MGLEPQHAPEIGNHDFLFHRVGYVVTKKLLEPARVLCVLRLGLAVHGEKPRPLARPRKALDSAPHIL